MNAIQIASLHGQLTRYMGTVIEHIKNIDLQDPQAIKTDLETTIEWIEFFQECMQKLPKQIEDEQ
jgi:hypothetical protein